MSYFDDREYDGDSEYDGQSVYDDQSDNDDQNDCNDSSEYDHLGDLQRQAEQRERCPYRICQDCHHEHECTRCGRVIWTWDNHMVNDEEDGPNHYVHFVCHDEYHQEYERDHDVGLYHDESESGSEVEFDEHSDDDDGTPKAETP